jgi:hypothetical protein
MPKIFMTIHFLDRVVTRGSRSLIPASPDELYLSRPRR